MPAGKKRSPWRALRHSLFVCGLSLGIALAVSIATFIAPDDETPSFLKAAASTPAQQTHKGESTSFGVLNNIARLAPGPARSASNGETPQSSDSEAVTAVAEERSTAAAAEESAAVSEAAAEGTPQARVTSALTSARPALSTFEAETAETVVSSSRFTTSTTANVAAARTQNSAVSAASSMEELEAGDRITVPVTFYYCEDTTGGARSGDGGGFCGAMRNGVVAHPGAAACDVAYLGQRFIIEGDPTGRTYVCADTGGGIQNQHRDIWFLSSSEGWAWQAVVGRSAVIQILP